MLKKIILSLLLGSIVFQYSHANITRVSFQLIGNLIVFEAEYNGQKGNFILDTGMGYNLFNSKYIDNNSVIENLYSNNEVVNSNMSKAWIDVNGFMLGGASFKADLQHVEQTKGISIMGIIGTWSLKRVILTLDFIHKEMVLQKAKGKNRFLAGEVLFNLNEAIPFAYKGHIPMIQAYLGNKAVLLGIDTGAEVNILSNKLITQVRETHEMSFRKVMLLDGTLTYHPYSQIKSIILGNYLAHRMGTIFSDLKQLNSLNGPPLDGLLGIECIKQFKVTFNFSKRELYVQDQIIFAGNLRQ